MKKIVVVGSANTDMITKVTKLPLPGETVLGNSFVVAGGGKGANQAIAASRAGGDVTFIACLGDDNLARDTISGYKIDHLSTEHIVTARKTASGVALIMVSEDGENIISVALGANNMLTPRHIDERRTILEQADILLLQLETPLETVIRAAKIAHQGGCHVILNPAPSQPLPSELLKSISTLTPNQTEAEKLTGIAVNDLASAQEAATILRARGVPQVILTMGRDGCLISNAHGVQHVPSFEVSVVDTTAAGDAFNGALATALCENKQLSEATRFANATAALTVTQLGAQPAIPKRNNIDWLLSNSQVAQNVI